MKDKICETCKWNQADDYDFYSSDKVCTNGKSDNWSDYTDDDDTCSEWEEKDGSTDQT